MLSVTHGNKLGALPQGLLVSRHTGLPRDRGMSRCRLLSSCLDQVSWCLGDSSLHCDWERRTQGWGKEHETDPDSATDSGAIRLRTEMSPPVSRTYLLPGDRGPHIRGDCSPGRGALAKFLPVQRSGPVRAEDLGIPSLELRQKCHCSAVTVFPGSHEPGLSCQLPG